MKGRKENKGKERECGRIRGKRVKGRISGR